MSPAAAPPKDCVRMSTLLPAFRAHLMSVTSTLLQHAFVEKNFVPAHVVWVVFDAHGLRIVMLPGSISHVPASPFAALASGITFACTCSADVSMKPPLPPVSPPVAFSVL